jgi:hypothetical protein
MTPFQHDLEALLNRHNQENASNTPDFLLAAFLTDCLAAWNASTQARDVWYGLSHPAARAEDILTRELPSLGPEEP